ncbi:TRAF3-interacting JNK-activating modulator isoform X1 [Ambystoma mexicanum]
MNSRVPRSPPGRWRLLESYEEKCDRRLETHEVLRSRVNVTSCRLMDKDWAREPEETLPLSPRQQEFSRRRKMEMEDEDQKRARVSPRSHTSPRRTVAMEDIRRTPQWKEAGCANSQLSWNNNISAARHQHVLITQNTTSPIGGFRGQRSPRENLVPTTDFRERGTQTTAESCAIKRNISRDSSQQTDRGTAVLDKEMLQLSEYLKEALHRELKLKRKLALLQELLTALLQASEKSWKAQLNEDTLKSKVGTLEQKLQVCIQNYPRDGVKKILLEMEDHKQKYEQKAKESVQKIIEDKMTAEKQLQNTQRSLDVTEGECFLWKEEYEKLKGEWGELTAKHVELQNELHILQSKLQWVDSQDVQLQRFQVRLQSLETERADLQSRIDALEEDNNFKREQLDSLRGRLSSEEAQKLALESRIHLLENELLQVRSQPQVAPQMPVNTHNNDRKEKHHRAELQKLDARLAAKEKECVELQTELDGVNDEYLSCLTKLRECRNQIKTFQGRKSKGCCSSCLMPFLVLFLAVAVGLFYITLLQHNLIR